jgi:DNA replication and repair protein RecF
VLHAQEEPPQTLTLSVEGSGKRRLKVDDVETPIRHLEGLVPQVWLTPKHDRLFSEGASERRNFLDRIVYTFHPDHARHRARYEYAWREREALLHRSRDPRWLGVLEEHLAREGVALARARVEVVERLNVACQARRSHFPTVQLACEGALEAALATETPEQVEAAARAALASARTPGDKSWKGAHRTDLQAIHGGKGQAAKLCSTGEQKAVLLSVILAQATLLKAQYTMPPLLLLDEVGAHLDEHKRAELFTEITALGSQAWCTGTEAELFRAFEERAQLIQL